MSSLRENKTNRYRSRPPAEATTPNTSEAGQLADFGIGKNDSSEWMLNGDIRIGIDSYLIPVSSESSDPDHHFRAEKETSFWRPKRLFAKN